MLRFFQCVLSDSLSETLENKLDYLGFGIFLYKKGKYDILILRNLTSENDKNLREVAYYFAIILSKITFGPRRPILMAIIITTAFKPSSMV